jgi:hypothetical protein
MIKKTRKHFRRIRRGTMKQNTRRNRNSRNRNSRNRNSRNRNSRNQKRGGGAINSYDEEDIQLFNDYISHLPDDNQKQWLLQNIRRMPYEEDYEYNFPMTSPPPDFAKEAKYYQGMDRIQGYLRGYGGW